MARQRLGPELKRFSVDQLRRADRLLFGRRTYEGMAAYWQAAQGEDAALMNSLPKSVASRTLGRVAWSNSQLLTADVVGDVRRLKARATGPIFVFGSADLSVTLLEHGLFDEIRILVVPIVIGTGTPLFGRDRPWPKFRLVDTQAFESGAVRLNYRPAAA